MRPDSKGRLYGQDGRDLPRLRNRNDARKRMMQKSRLVFGSRLVTLLSKRRVAILGTSLGWERAPFDDPSWEIWSCNKFALGLERCDRIFEIHKRWNLDDPKSPDKKYIEDLKNLSLPKKVVSIIPLGGKANIVIDRDDLFKRYGSWWFSSSFGYMVAMAIDENVSEIGFWGVDMESHEEYVAQQTGVLHLIDVARRAKIKIHIPDYSLLNREPLPYPDRFETTLALTLETKAGYIQKLITRQTFNLEKAKRDAYWQEGYFYAKSDTLSPDDRKKEEKLASDLKMQVELLRDNVERLRGELWATQHYRRLFVFNVLPPDIGRETDADIGDSGPT